MRDRSSERALAPRAVDIDLDPLSIAGACCELVDAVLSTATQSEIPSERPTNCEAVVML